jgi:hypothetical protein
MKNIAFLGGLLLVAVFLLIAGCTQPAPTPLVTPTPSPVATTVVPATTGPVSFGTPGPTQTLPPQYNVEFQVQTNGQTANPLTYVALMGGNGINYVTQIDVNLTMPDGTVKSQSMMTPHYSGQNVSFPCSTWQNRVEIWTTAPQVGKIKVYDEIVPFQSLNA